MKRHKDIIADKVVIGIGQIEIYGHERDGSEVWFILDVKNAGVKFLGHSDYDDDARTCVCGVWPISEYGPRCPSCPTSDEQAEDHFLQEKST